MTDEERIAFEKARRKNRKKIAIAAAVIVVAIVVIVLVFEFWVRKPIYSDWIQATTDSMESGALVFGKSHFYPESDLVEELTVRDSPPAETESIKLLSEGKWEKYDPEADEISILCKNGVTLTILKLGKRSERSREEFIADRFPNGYLVDDGTVAFSYMENREGSAFMFGYEFVENEDDHYYVYCLYAPDDPDMTYDEGSTAINAIFDSLRQYE